MVLRLALAAMLALFLGPTREAQVPPDARPLATVPAVYRRWHDEVMRCVGVEGRRFEDVSWWRVRAPDGFHLYGGGPWAGYYDLLPEDAPRIYLVEHGIHDRWLVKHEMIHHALSPVPGHPAPPFDRCEAR